MPTIDITIPRPLDWQKTVMDEAKRFNVVCIGRRAGKTTLGQNLIVSPETLCHPVGWFSPTYKDMLDVWRNLSEVLRPITARASASERRIELQTGGVIEFWSLDNQNSGRGRKYKRIIIDEAAFVPNLLDIWNMALFPTLVDYSGDAWIFSTPKGMNGFWHLYQLGVGGEQGWKCWQMPSTVNPILGDEEIETMRRTMPERIFQQEIEARFLDDAGGVFRGVMECATSERLTNGEPGKQYLAGVDVAAQVDYTVVSVFDVAAKRLVYMDRFNRVEYPVLEERLAAVYSRFNMQTMVIESNSIGRPVIDHMRQRGLSIQEFTTTNATKTAVIQKLQSAFEHGEIEILNDPILIGELQAFEGTQLSSHWKYSAPAGMHDDTVMSLAIGWDAISGNFWAW
jgi:phage terminase large subunit-like protein